MNCGKFITFEGPEDGEKTTQAELDQAWAVEAERRVAQIDRGEPVLVSGEKVFARIRRKYQGSNP